MFKKKTDCVSNKCQKVLLLFNINTEVINKMFYFSQQIHLSGLNKCEKKCQPTDL